MKISKSVLLGEAELLYLVVVFRDRTFTPGLLITSAKHKDVILAVKESSVSLL